MDEMERINSFRNRYIDELIKEYHTSQRTCDIGDMALIRAYYMTNERGYTIFTAGDIPERTDDLGQFTARLIEANINEFNFIEESTATMRILVQLYNMGWRVMETYEDTTRMFPVCGLRIEYTGD